MLLFIDNFSCNKYYYLLRRTAMSTLRKIVVELELGQTILVGPNHKPAEITKIEYHPKTGEISLNTTRGPRTALTFRLPTTIDNENLLDVADKYR
jgi:hypothetical protein